MDQTVIMKRWQKIWAGPSPPSFGQNPTATFFVKPSRSLHVTFTSLSVTSNQLSFPGQLKTSNVTWGIADFCAVYPGSCFNSIFPANWENWQDAGGSLQLLPTFIKNILFVWSYYSIGKVQEGLLKSSSICIQCCSPQTETPPTRRMIWYGPYHVIPLVTWFLTLWDAFCLLSWDHDMGRDTGNDIPSFDGCTCPNCGVTYERVCRHQVNKCNL